jgi:YesN/AraC family two-component response regulator
MRQGLIGIISTQPGIEVSGEAASGKETLELARKLRPDVIIMDVSMPGMDGVASHAASKRKCLKSG